MSFGIKKYSDLPASASEERKQPKRQRPMSAKNPALLKNRLVNNQSGTHLVGEDIINIQNEVVIEEDPQILELEDGQSVESDPMNLMAKVKKMRPMSSYVKQGSNNELLKNLLNDMPQTKRKQNDNVPAHAYNNFFQAQNIGSVQSELTKYSHYDSRSGVSNGKSDQIRKITRSKVNKSKSR